MRKAFIGVLATGLVAGAGLGLTATASATVAAAPSGGTTISFVSHPTSDKVFHLGSSKAFGVGYVELAAGNDIQGSTKIGHDDAVQTVTRLSGGTADEVVTVTFTLAGGQISTTGVVTSTASGPGTFELAITGGTGKYTSARGYATVVPANAPKVTLHITG
jgi:hypothetical protein